MSTSMNPWPCVQRRHPRLQSAGEHEHTRMQTPWLLVVKKIVSRSGSRCRRRPVLVGSQELNRQAPGRTLLSCQTKVWPIYSQFGAVTLVTASGAFKHTVHFGGWLDEAGTFASLFYVPAALITCRDLPGKCDPHVTAQITDHRDSQIDRGRTP